MQGLDFISVCIFSFCFLLSLLKDLPKNSTLKGTFWNSKNNYLFNKTYFTLTINTYLTAKALARESLWKRAFYFQRNSLLCSLKTAQNLWLTPTIGHPLTRLITWLSRKTKEIIFLILNWLKDLNICTIHEIKLCVLFFTLTFGDARASLSWKKAINLHSIRTSDPFQF